MKKYLMYLILSTFLMVGGHLCYSQGFEQITMHKAFGSTRFEYTKDTVTFSVSPKEVLQIMSEDPLAYEEFWKAKSNYSVAGVMGFTGAALIAFPLATAIAGGDPEWVFAAGSVALIIGSTHFSKVFNRHAQRAVNTFNKRHSAFRPHTEYFFTGLGARLTIKF